MSAKPSRPIPVPQQQFDHLNEVVMRRTVEQNFQDVVNDIAALVEQKDGTVTSAIRRHQFLLMGASNG